MMAACGPRRITRGAATFRSPIRVVGDGPFDLVFAPGFVSNVEYGWEEPTLERFYQRLGSFCRLIIFDKRGTGLSDRVSGVPDLETRMDDVRAIMDAVAS